MKCGDKIIRFTHQDPGFIDHVVNKKPAIVRCYLPPDANCLLSVMNHCLKSKHKVNVVTAGKHPSPQWLTVDEADCHCASGIGIWDWASNDKGLEPDVIIACCGDVPTLEALAATSILREKLPELKTRFVNVVNLMKLPPTSEHPNGLSDNDFDTLFTKDKPIVFAFHGYPHLVQKLIYRRTNRNLYVKGYIEEGTISTAFDMTVMNKLDRFNLVIDVCNILQGNKFHENKQTCWSAAYVKQEMQQLLMKHKAYINEFGVDMPVVENWKWEK